MSEPSKAVVLVVDDNEDNREILMQRLLHKGFEVRTAASGAEALRVISEDPVDLVMLDITMPGMDGFEVLSRIRESHTASALPVIMATAKSDSSRVVRALEMGANDYVTKPFDMPVVIARVESHLRLKRPRGSEEHASPEGLEPGTLLAGKYRIESRIGSGGFGTVYRARHQDLGATVAIKVLKTRVTPESDALARFRREGMSACRVQHANAVQVIDFGVTPAGIAYLVMEHLEGRSLLDCLNADGRYGVTRCVEILAPVCDVLAVAHDAGLVHRDIKPSNVFLQQTVRGERVKVLDFGLAKMAGDVDSKLSTDNHGLVGTLGYMAPERFRGPVLSGQSDVYSIGVMFYEMLTGSLPFVAPDSDPAGLVMLHLQEAPRPLRELISTLPVEVEALVLAALAKKADERPTAGALATRLRALAPGVDPARGARVLRADEKPTAGLAPPDPKPEGS